MLVHNCQAAWLGCLDTIAFHTASLINMVSAFFREIHTVKCKKLLFSILLLIFISSCSCKRCKTPYPQPTLLLQNTPPSFNSSLGTLSFGEQAFCLIFLTLFTSCFLIFLHCATERRRRKNIQLSHYLKWKLYTKQTIDQKSAELFSSASIPDSDTVKL